MSTDGHQQAARVEVAGVPAGPEHRLDGQARGVAPGPEPLTPSAITQTDGSSESPPASSATSEPHQSSLTVAHSAEVGQESAIDLERHRAT